MAKDLKDKLIGATPVYGSTPTLSKVKLSDGSTYFLKDADARSAIDTIAADYLKAADKTELSNLISNEETRAKDAEGGLETRIENLEARGRFLSGWNAGTGKPSDYPSVPSGASYPYTYSYKTGDYYIVTTVPAEGSTKYKPNGASITKDSAEAEWTIGTATETEKVIEGDFYIYSKTGWLLLPGSQKTIYFSNLAGNARDNTNLKGELEKVDAIYYKKDAETAATGLLVEEIAARIAGDESLDSSKQDKITSTSKLNADLVEDGTTNKVYTAEEKTKLGGIETGAQVNVIEHVKMNGADLTITDKRVDLGNVVPQERKIAGCTLTADIAVTALQGALGLEELAYSDTASGSTTLETIDSITMNDVVVSGNATVTHSSASVSSTGKFTPVGSVTLNDLTQTPTTISSTGSYQPEGQISVTLSGATFNKITGVGSLPSYTPATLTGGKATVVDVTKFVAGATATWTGATYTAASFTYGAFTPNTPTAIDTTKFNGGSAATWTGATYTAPSLDAAPTAKFAKKALKMTVGTGADAECLIFEDVADTDTTYFASAATANGTFNAGNVGFGTFNGGTAASLSDGFYTAGIAASKAEDTFTAGSVNFGEFNGGSLPSIPAGFVTAGTDVSYTAATFSAGSLPTMEENVVGIASKSFTGTTATITVSGTYDRATANGASFTGTEGDVAVSGTYDKADSTAAFSVTVTPTTKTLTRTAKSITISVTPDKA